MYYKQVRAISVIIFLSMAFLFTIAGKTSCNNRTNANAKAGSSVNNNAFTINAPSNLTATIVSYSDISLSWQDNSNNEDGFVIERKTALEENWTEIGSVEANVTFYSDTTLFPVTICFYRVRAINTIGDRSTSSNETNIWDSITWADVTAGSYQSYALAKNGMIWAWGSNTATDTSFIGLLGLGDTTTLMFTLPTLIGVDYLNGAEFKDVVEVKSGLDHVIARKSDGTLWGWGTNGVGQMGTGDNFDTEAPYPIGTENDWSKIAVGYRNTFAIKTNNTLWAWGFNSQARTYNGWYNYGVGMLGLGDTIDRNTPTQIGTQSDWVIVSPGGYHTIALKTNGTLWSWGDNMEFQLGLNSMDFFRLNPSQIGTDNDWLTSAAGNYSSFAIKTNGTLWAWGANWLGFNILAIPSSYPYYLYGALIPVQVGGINSDWFMVSPGYYQTRGLKSTGTIWGWGGGYGTGYPGEPPAQIGSDSDWIKLAGGYSHSIALKSDNTIWTWGQNQYGQLGHGDFVFRSNFAPCRIGTASPPSNLSLTVISSSQINITWTDNANNEIGYKLERSTDGVNYTLLSILNANTVLYSDTTVTSGNTYYYRVIAYNAYGNSVYSDSGSIVTPPFTPVLSATASSSSQIYLFWVDVNGETGYQLERSLDNITYSLLSTLNADSVAYYDTPLMLNTTYYYRIRAYNAGGNSDYSLEVNATTLTGPPAAPILLSVTVISRTRLDITWTDVYSETGYKVECSTTSSATGYSLITVVNTNSTSYPDATVNPSNTYYYRVSSYNTWGDSGYSNVISATTPALPVPFRPLSSDTPPIETYNDGISYTMGYSFSPTVNGWITALGRYIGSGTGNTTVILWTDAGVELARVTVSTDTGWVWTNLSTPIYIRAGNFYRVAVSCPGDYWCAPFTSWGIRDNINIDLSYGVGALDTFPDEWSANDYMYGWADIEFLEE